MKTTRRRVLEGSAALLAVPLMPAAAAEPAGLTLHYEKPAAEWTDALPVGNGRLGAMVFGGVASERIQINEATLWGGGPHDYVAPDAGKHLAELRRLIFAGQIEAAEQLTAQMMGAPPVLLPYQPFCDLWLTFEDAGETDDYARTLALDDATVAIAYRRGGVRFRRDVFVSYPDKALVVRLTADRRGKHNFSIGLSSPQPEAASEVTADDTLQLQGQIQARENPPGSWIASWNSQGLRYAAVLKVKVDGGSVKRDGARLSVRNADAVTILLGGATGFVTFRDVGADALARAAEFAGAAALKPYNRLKRAHLADFRALFHRVQLQLGPHRPSHKTTDVRIRDFKTADDPELAALYYQFGRYLLISSSRPGGQPANLQGIWNQDLVPAWGSKMTTNINLEMNYWLADSGALWETQETLWNLIGDLQVTGAETARANYGAGGWVLHHNTDLWRATTPVDGAWGMWPMGGVWLANQMWDHYRYSRDDAFLRARAYPAMKGAVRFVLDTLVEAPQGLHFAGRLVTNPSTSPENAYLLNGRRAGLTYAASMDLEMIAALFDAFAEASALLDTDGDLREQVLKAKDRLPPLQIGSRGQLQEWIEDYPETEPEHRHVSHLWALYPGQGISLRGTPELAAAAKRSLELRGDGGTGWAKAWKVALWARLGDGDHAHRLLKGLISDSTLPNMFDVCPPFQIDGNFGGAAAISEMLLQSDDGEIALLPALPGAWSEGRVQGLRARGGVKVDMEWRDRRLTSAMLVSGADHPEEVRNGGKRVKLDLVANTPVRLDANLRPRSRKA